MEEAPITESQFFMWRALFALVHADGIITEEEAEFMAQALNGIPFNTYQESVLLNDVEEPQNIAAMFSGISEERDRSHFFRFAWKLVWADGDFAPEEEEIMERLEELEAKIAQGGADGQNLKSLVSAFRADFLRGRFGSAAE